MQPWRRKGLRTALCKILGPKSVLFLQLNIKTMLSWFDNSAQKYRSLFRIAFSFYLTARRTKVEDFTGTREEKIARYRRVIINSVCCCFLRSLGIIPRIYSFSPVSLSKRHRFPKESRCFARRGSPRKGWRTNCKYNCTDPSIGKLWNKLKVLLLIL